MVDDGIEQGLAGIRRRRVIAGVLVGVVAVAVPTVLIAVHNPRHYVYLMLFGRTTVVVTVLVLSPTVLGVAAWLVLRNKLMARVLAGITVTLTALVCAVGYRISTTASIFGTDSDGTRTAVAVSPDGSFDLVVVRYSALTTDYEIVRVRSRSGLTSREADQDLACFAQTFDQFDPAKTFESARFVGEREVEVRTEAGEPWTTTFDPNTLLAAATVSRGCGD